MQSVQQPAHKPAYLAGVRRRLKTGAIVVALSIASGAVCFGVLSGTGSIPLMLFVGIVCGIASAVLDLKVDPVAQRSSEANSERTIWLVLFGPAILGLMAVCIYSAINPPEGAQLVGAGGVAILLGFVLAMTARILRPRNFA